MNNKTMLLVGLDSELVDKLRKYLKDNPSVDSTTLMNIALNEFLYQSQLKASKRKSKAA